MTRPPRPDRAPRRRRIADVAVEVLTELRCSGIMWGDARLFDAIAARAGMADVLPLERHRRVMDALRRSPRFRHGLVPIRPGGRLVRAFDLLGPDGHPVTFPVDAAGDGAVPPAGALVTIRYTNWRRETADRAIRPIARWFGATPWHPRRQWLLRALDVAKGAARDFAVADIHHWQPSPGAAPTVEAVPALPEGVEPPSSA